MSPPAGSRGVTRSEAVRFRLLGGFGVSVGSRTVESDAWRLKKAAALVKLLALAPGHRLHREQVMGLLWSDLGKRSASNNLRQVLHDARKTLDPEVGSRYLVSREESLILCPEGDLWVDADAFEEAAAAARREKTPSAYRAAIGLYAGDLLPEDRYEEWAEGRRQVLRRLYFSLLVELAGLCEERGEYERGIEALRRTVTEQPTLEKGHTGLMRLYVLSGRRRDALQQYEKLREALLRELAAEPDAATRRLRDDIASGKFSPAQPTGASQSELPDAGKHNLPAPRTSFVGRERELVKVKRELAMTRLLTLTGAGGSGKTRLAMEVARDLVGTYADGAWMVELAALSDAEVVPQAVAEKLGVREQPGVLLIDTLVDYMCRKQMLLVLDNCEHLMAAAAQLVDVLLDSCTGLRILATSREALNVVGEVRWLVPALSVPDPGLLLATNELASFESARLFSERAFERRRDFALVPENAQAVAEICHTLEGMPLAIELAAARISTLSARELSERLADPLKLLTGGGRTLTPRQRTLKGTLDWSHDLLSEPEQTLLRRLSVFAGGWRLEAAEALSSGDGVEEGDVLDLISGLVDKSLVMVVEATSEGRVRYRLLEPIRRYAWEKLEESGEAEAVRDKHAVFFLALAEEAERAYLGSEEREWLDRLEAEHDNLRAALSWLSDHKGTDLGLRLAAALVWFWHARLHYSEGARRLEEALTGASATDAAAQAKALRGLARILRILNDLGQAEALLEESLALYKELGDRAEVAESLATLGWVLQNRGDATRATTLFEESLAIARPLNHWKVLPFALTGLAWVAAENGDLERATNLYEEALAVFRELESSVEVSGTLFMMGYIELAYGNAKRASPFLEEALSVGREVGDKGIVTASLLSLGIAATLKGEPERAEELIKESLRILVEEGLSQQADIAECLEGLAGAAVALEKYLRAARLWGAAGALREVSRPWSPTERQLYEPWLAAARVGLDEAAWEAAFAKGKVMGLEEAVEYALSDDDPSSTTPNVPDRTSMDELPTLTRRELEIATLVARGLTNRQVASELSISEHTAATHLRRMLKKLGLRSRTQLATWVTEQGVCSPE